MATLARLGLLERHIRSRLGEMARELRRGSIDADPWYRTQQENACLGCSYADACHFAEGENGEHSRYMPRLKDKDVWELLEAQRDDREDTKEEEGQDGRV